MSSLAKTLKQNGMVGQKFWRNNWNDKSQGNIPVSVVQI